MGLEEWEELYERGRMNVENVLMEGNLKVVVILGNLLTVNINCVLI